MSTRPTLSLCMIVLDEEHFLAQALSNVRAHVDELIIVDGGSTDRTVWIAEMFGATIIHHPWNEHFADQRNISLAHATCDWILVMDADELFHAQLLETLPRLVSNNVGIDAFEFSRLNYVDNERTAEGPNFQIRLFLNNKQVAYVGRVHEYPEGFQFLAALPHRYIIHRKSSDRQQRQNAYYDSLVDKYHLTLEPMKTR